MWTQLLPGLRLTVLLTVLTGLIYPLAIAGLCQAMFSRAANGSIITRNGKPIGSELIGQSFTLPEYFHGRPSAAGSDGYDASLSGGSNLGPTSKKLMDRVKDSVTKLRAENIAGPIPSDMITTSASGLDPHITPATALAQSERIAAARNTTAANIAALIQSSVESRDLGFLGEPRVNVLKLNLALDDKYPLKR